MKSVKEKVLEELRKQVDFKQEFPEMGNGVWYRKVGGHNWVTNKDKFNLIINLTETLTRQSCEKDMAKLKRRITAYEKGLLITGKEHEVIDLCKDKLSRIREEVEEAKEGFRKNFEERSPQQPGSGIGNKRDRERFRDGYEAGFKHAFEDVLKAIREEKP